MLPRLIPSFGIYSFVINYTNIIKVAFTIFNPYLCFFLRIWFHLHHLLVSLWTIMSTLSSSSLWVYPNLSFPLIHFNLPDYPTVRSLLNSLIQKIQWLHVQINLVMSQRKGGEVTLCKCNSTSQHDCILCSTYHKRSQYTTRSEFPYLLTSISELILQQ